MRKHGKEKRRVWRKLNIALDANTHEIVPGELSFVSVADSEALAVVKALNKVIRLGTPIRERNT